MEILKELSIAFIWLIRVGTVTRVIYCFLKMGASEEEYGLYRKRMINAIVFLTLAESIWQLKGVAIYYFGV